MVTVALMRDPAKLPHMRKLLVAAFLMLAGACGPAAAEPHGISIDRDMLLEPVGEIPIEQWWHIAEQQTRFEGGAAIALSQFDDESAPVDGDWRAVGLVGIGLGDVGERPVAFRVWVLNASRETGHFRALEVQPSAIASSFRLLLAPGHAPVEVRIGDGRDVFVNDRLLGRISY